MMFIRLFLSLALTGMAMSVAAAQPRAADADAIRHVMKETWDKPDAAVEVSPVVVVSDYAIAGWTQGPMGGRALLRRRTDTWAIILCAGDQLKQAQTLRMAGVPEKAALALVQAMIDAENNIPPARAAMLSKFDGLVTLDGHDGHAR